MSACATRLLMIVVLVVCAERVFGQADLLRSVCPECGVNLNQAAPIHAVNCKWRLEQQRQEDELRRRELDRQLKQSAAELEAAREEARIKREEREAARKAELALEEARRESRRAARDKQKAAQKAYETASNHVAGFAADRESDFDDGPQHQLDVLPFFTSTIGQTKTLSGLPLWTTNAYKSGEAALAGGRAGLNSFVTSSESVWGGIEPDAVAVDNMAKFWTQDNLGSLTGLVQKAGAGAGDAFIRGFKQAELVENSPPPSATPMPPGLRSLMNLDLPTLWSNPRAQDPRRGYRARRDLDRFDEHSSPSEPSDLDRFDIDR